jgi:hypothetical protein
MVATLKNVLRLSASGLILFLMVSSLSTFLSNQARQLWLALRDPYANLAAMPLQPSFASGEPLAILYNFDCLRYCETNLNLFIATSPGNDIVWRHRTYGGATLLGPQHVRNSFEVPRLAAGHYSLRSIVYSLCSDGAHTQAFPEVFFDIAG